MAGATTSTTVVRPECCSSASRRCWEDLPDDIMDSILGRLTLHADYYRFGAVCSSWRRASLDPNNRDRFSLSATLLLSPSDETLQPRAGTPWKCSLFDFTTPMVKELTLPPIRGGSSQMFCGSSHGWLMFAEGHSLSLILVNPFYITGGGGMIRLPNLVRRRSFSSIRKFVLSADPALCPDDYFVCVICVGAYDNRTTQFIKSGEKDWELIGDNHQLHVDDVVFHDGNIYVLDQDSGIYICDLTTTTTTTTTTNLRFFAHLPTISGHGQCCIVVSPAGEILLVCRSNESPAAGHFNVFKAKMETDTITWYETKNLGDKVIRYLWVD